VRFRLFAPLDRELSTLVLGTAIFEYSAYEDAVELLDAWLELGGNAIDTGRQYGNAESILGRWLHDRNAHDQVTVITKAGHYDEVTLRPRVTESDLAGDLANSLRELGVDKIELLLLHRDDAGRPVSAILHDLCILNESGWVRAFGASNWTTKRLEEAACYARDDRTPSFSCSSPNLSLAVANEPAWPGCVSVQRGVDEAWYTRTQFPVFSWQALAGGFFAGVDGTEIRRVYGSPANTERLRRAQELAQQCGCTPSQIALAWVLAQPYPVYAIIGPRSRAELEDCVHALDLQLTQHELDWLDLRDDPPSAVDAPAFVGSSATRPLGSRDPG
jgi:aryl-alcohol dehydrogenase-like predicted oxidoreductase